VNKFLSIITLLVASASAVASGYVTSSDGQVVKTESGLCLHTGYYTSADAVKGCDAVPVAPVKPVPVTLNSDVLFAFDSAKLTTAGKAALDALAPQVAGQGFVEGHTDRIGTVGYNKTLSVARAKAVADYLSTKTKSTFVVSGVGATQPSGKTAECIGPMSPQLIACLSPDRRVIVTIIK
jgi:OOP family OmpA-OmpF porin